MLEYVSFLFLFPMENKKDTKTAQLGKGSVWSVVKRSHGCRGSSVGFFGGQYGNSTPCQSAWCGDCYTSPKSPTFPTTNQQLKEKVRSKNDRLVSSWEPLPHDDNEYLVARNGDHLMAPFECDFCIFRKLKQREPINTDDQNNLLLASGVRQQE